jgi:hypothetical protein
VSHAYVGVLRRYHEGGGGCGEVGDGVPDEPGVAGFGEVADDVGRRGGADGEGRHPTSAPLVLCTADLYTRTHACRRARPLQPRLRERQRRRAARLGR